MEEDELYESEEEFIDYDDPVDVDDGRDETGELLIDSEKDIATELFSNFESTVTTFKMIAEYPEEAQTRITILNEDRKRIEAKEEANQIVWVEKERQILKEIESIYTRGYERGLDNKSGLELTKLLKN